MSGVVGFEVVKGIARIHLNAPEKGNALSDRMVRELTQALTQADQDVHAHAILLTGAGENFCSGGDLNDFRAATQKSLDEGYQDIQSSMALFALGFQLRTPLVARIQGSVRGGGVGLVAMAHLAVADIHATFALPEVQLGLFPFGIFPLLARALGPRRALELALSGRVFDVDDAQDYGLVHAASTDSLGVAEDYAHTLASRSPLALTTGLEAYNHLTDPGSWPLDYLGLLRQLTFKSDTLATNVQEFLARQRQSPQN